MEVLTVGFVGRGWVVRILVGGWKRAAVALPDLCALKPHAATRLWCPSHRRYGWRRCIRSEDVPSAGGAADRGVRHEDGDDAGRRLHAAAGDPHGTAGASAGAGRGRRGEVALALQLGEHRIYQLAAHAERSGQLGRRVQAALGDQGEQAGRRHTLENAW